MVDSLSLSVSIYLSISLYFDWNWRWGKARNAHFLNLPMAANGCSHLIARKSSEMLYIHTNMVLQGVKKKKRLVDALCTFCIYRCNVPSKKRSWWWHKKKMDGSLTNCCELISQQSSGFQWSSNGFANPWLAGPWLSMSLQIHGWHLGCTHCWC